MKKNLLIAVLLLLLTIPVSQASEIGFSVTAEDSEANHPATVVGVPQNNMEYTIITDVIVQPFSPDDLPTSTGAGISYSLGDEPSSSSVPEPSSTLLVALVGTVFATKRRRRTA